MITLKFICCKSKGITGFYFHCALSESADPVLRALGIQHNRNGLIQLFTHRLDQIDLFLMLLVGTVGKIQSGNIHARLTHLSQHLLILTGRTYGTDNFRLSPNLPRHLQKYSNCIYAHLIVAQALRFVNGFCCQRISMS